MKNKLNNISFLYNLFWLITSCVQIFSTLFQSITRKLHIVKLKKMVLKQLNGVLESDAIKTLFEDIENEDYEIKTFDNGSLTIQNMRFKIEVIDNELMGKCYNFKLVESGIFFGLLLREYGDTQEFKILAEMELKKFMYYSVKKKGDSIKLVMYEPLGVPNFVTNINEELANQCFELGDRLKQLVGGLVCNN